MRRWRLGLAALALLAQLLQLAWQHQHGGVVAHHLLDRAELPTVSNGWGALLLPALVWFLTGRMQRRFLRSRAPAWVQARAMGAGLLGALLFGAGIAAAFTHGDGDLTSALFEAMIVAGLLAPGYRAECVLGFVLGMAATFGVVLPTAVACIVASASALLHAGVIRPAQRVLAARGRGFLRRKAVQ